MVAIRELGIGNEESRHWFENPNLHIRLKEFRTPPILSEDELSSLMEFYVPSRTYDTGLVIGRFQPLHFGHIFLMIQALKVCDNIVIGVGSANVINDKNPFPAQLRERMLQESLHEFGLTSRVKQIVRLNDFGNDQQWFDNAQSLIKKFDVVVGNNDNGVNRIFRERGIPTIQTQLLDRDLFQGTHIRGKLTDEGLLPQIS